MNTLSVFRLRKRTGKEWEEIIDKVSPFRTATKDLVCRMVWWDYLSLGKDSDKYFKDAMDFNNLLDVYTISKNDVIMFLKQIGYTQEEAEVRCKCMRHRTKKRKPRLSY
jgi:hypothetical protein